MIICVTAFGDRCRCGSLFLWTVENGASLCLVFARADFVWDEQVSDSSEKLNMGLPVKVNPSDCSSVAERGLQCEW